jgi:hypothetical protein
VSTPSQIQAPVRMLKVGIKLTAILQNPDGIFEDELNADVPEQIVDDPKVRMAICQKFLAQSTAGGMLQRPIDDDTLEAIPMVRVKAITVKLASISRLALTLV